MFLLTILTASLLFCSCFAREQDVAEYTDSDFSSRIAEHEVVLVMFYAPWCGHCKRLKPIYAKAAEDLLRNDPPVILAKVDCTEGGKDTCNKFSVSGYPTLKIFRNGEFSQEYGGPREAVGIVKYMKSQVGPSSKELSNEQELEKFIKAENDVAVVGFFVEASALKDAFLKTADKLREKVRFAHGAFAYGTPEKTKDGIILFRPSLLQNKFEDSSVLYTGSSSSESISEFITQNYYGLVGYRTTDNRQDFKNPLVVAYYSVDYVKNAKGTNYWRNRILKVAKEFQGQIAFAISSKDDFQNELNEYGIDFVKGDKPTILARDAKNQKFIMGEEFSIEALQTFVKDLLADKLVPYLKSEAVPESNDAPVKIAVAKNFDEVVVNNNRDTLIEFYAPWCGHCKKLAPAYDELAEKLIDEEVAIVKMDATANDVPPTFEVRGFPTLFWVPKDSKDKPIRYDGGREVDEFIKYIAKQATNELKGYDRKGNPKQKTEL